MADKKLTVQLVAVDSLINDPKNARKHNAKNIAAIEKSLTEFGQQRPIIVDADNVVVAGNGTLEAARNLGWTQIAVTVSTLDAQRAKAFALADNRTAELADWDSAQLLESLKELDELDLLNATGFTDAELNDLNKFWGDAPDLDELLKEIGDLTEEDTMTRVSFVVPPEYAAYWEMTVREVKQGTPLESICHIIKTAYETFVENA